MADWRKLYGKICENQELGECSIGANLLFERILTKTDDTGKFYADPTLINKLVFTNRKDIKDRQISKWLEELTNKNLIKLYKVENKKYLYFLNFNKYQKLRKDIKPKICFPEPPVTDAERPVTDAERPVDIRVEESRVEENRVEEILSDLNLVLGTSYKPTTQKTKELIQARLNEGFTIDDFKTVHRKMLLSWGADPKMVKYLRPITLYGIKFEGYLNQKEVTTKLSEAGIKAYLVGQAWLNSRKEKEIGEGKIC
jgi:uncharacterized phage protein (TIGR02220 family)